MDLERKFKEEVNSCFDDDNNCQGLIVNNIFPLVSKPCKNYIGTINTKDVYEHEKISRNFVYFSPKLFELIRKDNNIMTYKLLGFICENIKYNFNIVEISRAKLCGYLGRNSINNRDYMSTLYKFQNIGLLSFNSTFRSKFIINPFYLYKGDVRIYKAICDYLQLNNTIVEDGRVVIDRAIVIRSINNKKDIEIEIYINKKRIKTLTVKNEDVDNNYSIENINIKTIEHRSQPILNLKLK